MAWIDDANDTFEVLVRQAVESLPSDLRSAMSNVEIVVEHEPANGQPLLGLYHGVPLTRRSSGYSGVLPDKISIYRGPIERRTRSDPELLRAEIRRVVLHEIAHHFRDQRPTPDRYRPLLDRTPAEPRSTVAGTHAAAVIDSSIAMRDEAKAARLRCAECGTQSDDQAEAWKAFLTDEPAEVAVYCPDCAEREFGDGFRWVG